MRIVAEESRKIKIIVDFEVDICDFLGDGLVSDGKNEGKNEND